jgi:DNA sulfur modification protein DndB
MSKFEYTFPSIRGVQAGSDYYVSMCPLRLIPKIFLFDEEELTPELRAQRTLNKIRIPEMARYILENKNNYVFSAITASINGATKFKPIGTGSVNDRLGLLYIDMGAQFIINDGQHRRAAIEEAIKSDTSLGDETIAVVFFVDRGLSRSQQMFADLNRHAIRPSRSLGLLYDHRNDTAKIARLVALKCEAFQGLVELDKSALSERSRKLFTLSALSSATSDLLVGYEVANPEAAANEAMRFWAAVAKQIPEWQLLRKSKITSGEIRREFVHSHGVLLQAIGRVGSHLLSKNNGSYAGLNKLSSINWARSNAKDWEGRVMIGGRISKASNSITLATSFIKKKLGLDLSPEELRAESALGKSRRNV